jgi:Tfp pilus assembly protein PilZ
MDDKRQQIGDGIEKSIAEKRQSDRKKLIVDVKFEGGDTTGIANTENISLGGIFIKTNTYFEEGTPLFLRLTLGGKDVVFTGIVAYVEEREGVGIQFQDLSAETEELLKRELNR